jgi:hypothetical protein
MVPATFNQPSVVRVATPADKTEVLRLIRAAHAESGIFPLSENKIVFFVDRFLNPAAIPADDTGPRGTIGVIGESGRLEGAILLSIGSPWNSDETTLDELLNIVDPAHRQSNHARALIAYSKYITDRLRSSYPMLMLIIGVLSTARTFAKVRFYQRALSRPAGLFFTYPALGG